jgi:glycosyltransferase involved in cell wall biosynthesis
MIRVLVNFLYWGSEESGIFRAGSELIKYLSNYPLEIFLLTNKNIFYEKENLKIKKINLTLKHKETHLIYTQFYIKKFLSEINPNILFNPFHLGYLFNLNIPQIIIIYDNIHLTVFKKRLNTYIYHKFLLPRLISKSKIIIIPSQVSKNELVSFFKIPENKIKVVYLGVDKEKFKNLNLQKENFYLIVNATFPYKNVDYVIKLWRKFDIKENLIIVGYHYKYIKYHDYLKELTKKLYLENRIIFYPKVTDEELIELYNKAKALISPSLKEGFGLPPLEALACGTPIILSNIPVYKEIYGDIGIFFDLNNDESFLLALEKLKNLNLNEFEEKRKEFLKKFDWQKTAEEVYKIIKDAL